MDVPGGAGKLPNTSLSFRYNANNEELEELYNISDDDPPTPHCDASPSIQSENASPRRTSSIIDKYFKSMKLDKTEKLEELKSESPKTSEEVKTVIAKDVTSSPVKDYLNRLSKRTTTSEASSVPEGPNETWKIFHDFKYKIAQAVEDMKSRSTEEAKDKSIPRDNSTSDSEENSAIKDIDLSVGDTDNQVSSLDSSIQNLSEITQPITAKANDQDSLPRARTNSESTDDTHKNLEPNDSLDIPKDQLEDINMEVESGVEAVEDVSDGNKPPVGLNEDISPANLTHTQPVINYALIPPPSEQQKPERRTCFMDFTMYLMTIVLLLSYTILPEWTVWNAFLLGMWVFYFCSNLKKWVLDNYFSKESSTGGFFRVKRSKPIAPTYTIPSVKEHRPLKKFDGWINHYRSPDYDPYTYHINKTTTAFMKLEGCNLRISYTQAKVAKRALWDEKIENVTFYQHRLYNLTGARVILLPKGLVRKRQWSKKYPICVVLNESEKIQVLEKEVGSERRLSDSTASDKKGRDQTPTEVESTETNTSSPEKKKKFVWRKREKSVSHAEIDTSREGLRHRLVRKMHRDKKTDSVATSTDAPNESQQTDAPPVTDESAFFDAEAEPPAKSAKDDDDDFDESELLRINEFLDEAESEAGVEPTGDGEWSVHVRPSLGKHSHIYLFARTGRDKHEWFRRLSLSISEANSADSSRADERSASESQTLDKDVNLAVYRVLDKEVSFAKPPKSVDPATEQLTPPTVQLHPNIEAYEKSFWPYLFKIIQSKSPSGCQCRLLPPEVTWVNTVMARLLYDAMRDPRLVLAAQNRIQRKLNTLKLPSFMSPLIVTELSLAGACPLVESVSAPSWDERGVWLDADLRYDGGAYLTILTQINLMKLKEKNVTLEDHMMVNENTEDEVKGTFSGNFFSNINLRQRKPAIYDSDCEDSAESSSDDESPPVQPVDSAEHILPDTPTLSVTDTNQGSSKKKFLRMVDKIAMNKYFQQVTDYKYVKRAMEGLSNTDIKLQLEVHGLEGRLALNLPPPPHDRLWIGFRTNPHLVLKARPAFGARTLRFAHISNWIEQKLSKEFEKFLVLPNMEDITIDLMTPTPVHFE